MGSSRPIPLIIEVRFAGGTFARMEWHVRSPYGRADGTPNDRNLSKWVAAFEATTQPGGCNAHLGPMIVFSARIVRQSTREVVAAYRGPSFVVLEPVS